MRFDRPEKEKAFSGVLAAGSVPPLFSLRNKKGDAVRILEFSVPKEYDGVRLKGFLHGFCGLSVRQFAALKRFPGGVLCNGRSVIATDFLHEHDKIRVAFPDDKKFQAPVPLPFTPIYEDDDIFVAEKPASMPMYPAPGHDRDSLANAVSYYWLETGQRFSFRPVYRLDKDTTGIVVLAKHSFAASRLSGNIKKLYLAICEGEMPGGGVIDRPIGLKEGHTVQRTVTPEGDRAVTLWRCLACGYGHSLLAVRIKTGRTHQIRVHLSDCGHSLAGDDMYGGSRRFLLRQALHCAQVRFRHPVSGKMLKFRSALPDDMKVIAEWINHNE